MAQTLFSFGAIPGADETEFHLWAPSALETQLLIEGRHPVAMQPGKDGWLTASAPVGAGARYKFKLPDGSIIPDPASRAQAGDIHDHSVVVDHAAYTWRNDDWRGRPWHEAVIYETHVGTEGGFLALQGRLPALKEQGFTAIQLMPVNDFPGPRNWGYDGVLPYAPDAAYGAPDDLKSLVDTAHDLGLMIFMDVVYNHFGPDGNYWHALAEPFFCKDSNTPWGAAIDFRNPEVQSFFIGNAISWINDYRFDGLRFDAVHAINDDRFLDQMAAVIREAAGGDRQIHLILENERNDSDRLRNGYSAQWTDDWHHCLHVLLTGEQEGYYEDFKQAADLLARCCREGFAYQGEVSPHSGEKRGKPSGDLPSTCFVISLQTHDQVGNRAMGDRLTTLANPDSLAAATVLQLLSPFIPMVFMGEEEGATAPFLFFTSHNDELAKLVREGRRKEFKHFKQFQDEKTREQIPDPNDPMTFERSNWLKQSRNADRAELYRALLRLRAERIVPGIAGCRSIGADAHETGVTAQWRLGTGETLSIAVNLGDAPMRVTRKPGSHETMLFESTQNAHASWRDGFLPPRAAVATLGKSG